jgi:hypothetical protein
VRFVKRDPLGDPPTFCGRPPCPHCYIMVADDGGEVRDMMLQIYRDMIGNPEAVMTDQQRIDISEGFKAAHAVLIAVLNEEPPLDNGVQIALTALLAKPKVVERKAPNVLLDNITMPEVKKDKPKTVKQPVPQRVEIDEINEIMQMQYTAEQVRALKEAMYAEKQRQMLYGNMRGADPYMSIEEQMKSEMIKAQKAEQREYQRRMAQSYMPGKGYFK